MSDPPNIKIALIAYLPTILIFFIYCWSSYLVTQRKSKVETKRDAVLQDPDKGFPVWFSLKRELGLCHHVVLYTNRKKYELRLFQGRDGPAKEHSAGTKYPPYPGRPTKSGFVAIHIGWTKRSHEEIEKAMQNIIKSWRYNMITQNCQHFLRILSDDVVDDKFDPGFEKMEYELGGLDGRRRMLWASAALGMDDGSALGLGQGFSGFGHSSGGDTSGAILGLSG